MCHRFHLIVFLCSIGWFQKVRTTTDWHFTGPNIALDKNVTQYPGSLEGYTADLAVDGNTDGNISSGTCSQTLAILHNIASWTVDLGGMLPISGIIIYNRNDLHVRLKHFKVYGIRSSEINGSHAKIYDDIDENKYLQNVIKIPLNGFHNFSSIEILVPGHTGDPDNGLTQLSLCEVQVFAAPNPGCLAINYVTGYMQASIYNKTGRLINGYNTVGTVVKFACTGSNLVGSNAIKCLPNGQYNASIPTCQRGCLSPFSNKSDFDIHKVPYDVNETLTVNCSEGYESDVPVIHCSRNGQWVPDYHCNQIQCKVPNNPKHGIYVSKYSQNNILPIYLVFKSEITVKCYRGYEYRNKDQTRVCQGNKSWSGPEVACTRIRCMYPGNITNGYYTMRNGSRYISGAVDFGTIVRVLCNIGYNRGGITVRHCGQNKWTGQNPVCTPVTCTAPGTFQYGVYSKKVLSQMNETAFIPVKTNEMFVYSSEIYAVCFEGFILTGMYKTRMCSSSNTWTGGHPTCRPVNCSWPLKLENGRYIPSAKETHKNKGLAFDTVLSATCNDMFRLQDGYKARTCTNDGSWDQKPAKCVPLCKVPNITNGYIAENVTGMHDMETSVRIICNGGYSLEKSEYITCQNNHTWNQDPTCIGGETVVAQTSSRIAVIGGAAAAVLVTLLFVFMVVFILIIRKRRVLEQNNQDVPYNRINLQQQRRQKHVPHTNV